MNKLKSFVLLCIIAAVAFGMYKFIKSSSTPAENNNFSAANTAASSIMISEEEAKKLSDMFPLHLYFLNENGDLLKQEIRYITKEEFEKGTENNAKIVLDELIKGPSPDAGLKPSIDNKTKINAMTLEDKKIEIDFDENFLNGDVKMAAMSVVNSLCDIDGIDEVYIKINGDSENQKLKDTGLDKKLSKDMNFVEKDENIM